MPRSMTHCKCGRLYRPANLRYTLAMLWQEQTWQTIAAKDKQTPVIIPLGSCEQHGHHLPLFVDTIQVQAVADQLERAMSDRILMLPALWLGSSHHHIDFSGTVSLPPELYTSVIKQVAGCVLRAGFKRIFFLNGHGGNEVPVSQALAAMVAESDQADDAYLSMASWWGVGRDALKPEKHGLTTPAISHACEIETSMMLAIRPDLVKMDRAQSPKPAIDNAWNNSEYGGKVSVYRRWHRVTAPGNMGSPTEASKEKGESMLKEVVKDVVKFIDDFAHWPELPKIGPK